MSTINGEMLVYISSMLMGIALTLLIAGIIIDIANKTSQPRKQL